ncbi:MAG TPA: chloride channel protein [Steroidobacteraceae bacterium]|nr:chloride channel protein [Steroidobacteraceae bacterium]
MNSTNQPGAPLPVSPVVPVPPGHIGLAVLSVLALLVGVVTGFGAVGFRDLIGLIHNGVFLGELRFVYDANVFTPASPWGAMVILVPVIGALAVTFLVAHFAPEARGHGVPEVMEAIYYRGGIIRPIVAVVKSVASAIAIGTGASVGREGPIIQIGSALGSTVGQLVRMAPGERIVLVAAGAGAGIAATFNTPIGGVLFAIELMMPEVSARTFLPVALATGTATFIGRVFLGDHPAFLVPTLAPLGSALDLASGLGLYALLGAMTGVAAAAFVRGLHLLEDLFDRIAQRYLRHALGMLLVGLLMYALLRGFGHYYIEGVGYATVQAILTGGLSAVALLALLFICKLLATSLSLGSGSSGGIFSPSLFMGATLGGAYAAALSAVHLPITVNIPAFAMVGMGAMVGGATGASMTAIAMIFEMTRDYQIVLPLVLAVAMSVGVRRLLSRENIYTMKLFRRGHAVPKALHANMFLVRSAKDIMDTQVLIVTADESVEKLLSSPNGERHLRHIVVGKDGRIAGVLRINTALRHASAAAQADIRVGEVASRDFIVVGADDIAFDVIEHMWRDNASMAVVVRGPVAPEIPRVLGVITKEHIADAVAASVAVYPG